MAVSFRGLTMTLLSVALALPATASARPAGIQTTESLSSFFSSPVAVENHYFGQAVAATQDTLVVGASNAAYVYVRNGTVWTRQATLKSSDMQWSDYFGTAVAVSGDTIAVYALRADRVNLSSGAVYVFVRNGTTWTEQAKLTSPGKVPEVAFGSALALEGDTLLIGEPNDLWDQINGSVYAYTRSGDAWALTDTLVAADAAENDQFGFSLDLQGDTCVVGALLDDDGAMNSGSAYLFTRSGADWSQTQKLVARDPGVGDCFGESAAIDGAVVAVGAPSDDGAGVNSGAVYAFSPSDGTWAQRDKLVAVDAAAGGSLGGEVDVSGGQIVAGAERQSGKGAAYLFSGADGARAQTSKLLASGGAADDLFGSDVAFAGTAVAVGAEWDDDRGFNSGSVFLRGGTAAGSAAVTRVAGATRYDVAANLARRGWDPAANRTWPGVKHVIVANGEDGKEADPLCAAGLAGVLDAPVLLVKASSVPAATKAAISEIAKKNPGLQVHIIGGTASVPDARWTEIRAIPGVSRSKDRVAGLDRYGTSAAIAKRMVTVAQQVPGMPIPGVILVAADNPNAYYDALAASPIAFAQHMPMLAVKRSGMPPATIDVLFRSTNLWNRPRYFASSSAYISLAPSAEGARMTTSSNRYTAASQIGNMAIANSWLTANNIGLAAKLPDALTGGTFLGKRGGVLLFTDSSATLQGAPRTFVTSRRPQMGTAWIFGGTAAVPAAQETALRNLLK